MAVVGTVLDIFMDAYGMGSVPGGTWGERQQAQDLMYEAAMIYAHPETESMYPNNPAYRQFFKQRPDLWQRYLGDYSYPQIIWPGGSVQASQAGQAAQSAGQLFTIGPAPNPTQIPIRETTPAPRVPPSNTPRVPPSNTPSVPNSSGEVVHYASGTDTPLNIPPGMQVSSFPLPSDSQQSPSIGKWVLGILAALALFK